MIIYNQNKEFIGIDDEDLRLLGFSSLGELLEQCSDIAELFVKKPGYIHDFKNFQWIDFVMHAHADIAKAIVRTQRKEFTCDIVIKPFHLTQSPDSEAFAVYLQHAHPSDISSGEEPASQPSIAPVPETYIHETTEVSEEVPLTEQEEPDLHESMQAMPDFTEETILPDIETVAFDPYDHPEEVYPDLKKPLDIEEDIFLKEEIEVSETIPEKQPEKKVESPIADNYYTPSEQHYIDNLKSASDYVFDPHIAADELGLPVDLIEEFIRDFIQQSHEFHDELFESATKSDFDNVKTLSHKLKGVAANLRVEDAFEMLSIINTSHDQTEIEALLKSFYRTIAKLEGEELPSAATASSPIPEPEILNEPVPETLPEEDIYSFDILDTEPPKTDENLPPRIEADDLHAVEDLVPESTPAPQEETTIDRSDNLAAEAEYELPPMDMSLLDEALTHEASEPEEPPVTPYHYNAQKAADELGLDIELIQELQQDFISDAKELKIDLEASILSLQSDQWQRTASQLKGIADNLRMQEIASVLQTLTQTTDPLQAEQAMHQLYSYVDQL